MHIDWWTLALQAINVLILVALLGRFLFRPVIDAIAARQASANALLADARTARDTAQTEAQALAAQNQGFLAEAAKRRAEGDAAAETARAQLLDAAKAEAAKVVAQGQAALDAERTRIAAQWRASAADLAARMAGTLLERIPPEHTEAAMLDSLKARLATLPEATRRQLSDDGPATVVTPVLLSDAMAAAVNAALAGLLPVAPAFAVDPALIAGIEIHAPHVAVRNSWRADLDAMLEAAKEDGRVRTDG